MWAHVFHRKLPNCHRYSIFITQKHQKLISSFHYSSLNLVRIEWRKQKLRTNPNKCYCRGTHQFWIMGDVECLAAAWALCFARDCGLTSIILESDFETVNKALRSENDSFTSYSHLVGKVKILAEAFCDITFSHTHRQGNFVVHNIARYTRNVSGLLVLMEDVIPHLN